ncbi:MAG: amino acid permease [Nanobdellota archaeon]
MPKSSVGLKKSLSFKTIIFLTVNSIMGTGIFFLPAVGAKAMGTSSIIAWVVLSLISIYIATLFAELCSMFPKAGGIYEFAKQVYPRSISFLIGWSALLASNITIAMLTIGAIQYLLPFEILYVKELVSIFFIILFNYISFKGIKTSSTMLVTFAFITLGTLSLIIIPNFLNLNPANLTPTPWNLSILLVTIFLIAETFFGWESPLFLAEETKNGHIIVPRALVIGTVFITLISLLLVISALGSLDHQVFAAAKAPLLALAQNNYGSQAIPIFTILIYVSLIGSVAGWITTSPRLILSLAQDKLFPKRFAEIHPKNATPHKAILFQATVSVALVFIGSGNYHALLEMLLPLLLLLYSTVIITVAILRIKRPDIKRYFHAPFPRTGPFAVIIFFGVLFYFWLTHSDNAIQSIQLAATFIVVGIPVYGLMQLQYDHRTVNKLNNLLAYLTLMFESIVVPRSIRSQITHLLGNVKGKTVFEFGCSVGSLTKHLAEEVGPEGRIFATDISTKSIDITTRRMQRNGHTHVKALQDHRHSQRVHPEIPHVDKIVSISVLDSVEKLDDILFDMNNRMEKGGRICFVEYDRFFYIFSNLEWISSDTMIKHIFRRNGFLVGVQRQKSILWEVIFIYGKKIKDVDKPEEYQQIDTALIAKKEPIRLHSIMKTYLMSHEHEILKREIGVGFYHHPKISVYANPEYFQKVLTILTEVSLYSCPDGGIIIITAKEDASGIHLQVLSQIRRKVLVLFLDPSKETLDEETHTYKKHRSDLEYLEAIITAMGGTLLIDQIWEKHDPVKLKELEVFILGIYEESVIQEGQDYLNIDIHLPHHGGSDTTGR